MSGAETQLGRVEAARLVRNPVVWVGFAMSAQWLRSAVDTDNGEDAYNLLVGYGLVVPGFVMIFHVALAVLRPRATGVDELLSTVPLTPDRRSVGHAMSALAAGVLGAAWAIVLLVVLRPGAQLGTVAVFRDRASLQRRVLDVPRPNVAQLLQGPMAVVVAVCLGIALVRWIPTWLVMVPLVLAAMMQLTFAGLWSGAPSSIADWLNPLSRGWVHDGWVGCSEDDPWCELTVEGFDRVTPWWHLGYLAALAVLLVVVAVLRHRRDRAAWLAFGAALAAVVALAAVQFVVHERFTPVGS